MVRPWLPAGAAKKLAHFVAHSLLQLLTDRRDLDPRTVSEVKAVVLRRIDAAPAAKSVAAESPPKAAPAKMPISEALARARQLKAAGKLDEAAVLAALGGDRTFARAALAVLGNQPAEVVDRVLSAHSAKGVTSLVWLCGLSMRAAVKVQIQLGQIPPSQALQPRGGGAYPMSEEAMRWQLDFFGVIASQAAGT